mmetsp:Transcript_10618/g.19670  ORF Transcript_10618/g.19670 Transcript_10618/m.19670 type:complete len:707 (-) Transcript_10618:160-2280(-)
MAIKGSILVQTASGLQVKGRGAFKANQLFDATLESLHEWLTTSENKVIADVDLSENPLTQDQFSSLLTVLVAADAQVARFRLSRCTYLNDQVMQTLSDYFRLLTPEKAPVLLDLSNCAITSIGFRSFMSAMEESALYPLSDPEGSGRGIPLYLHLGNNPIDEADIQAYVLSGLVKPFDRKGPQTCDLPGPKVFLMLQAEDAGFQQQESSPSAVSKKRKKDCKWCQMGECWTHQGAPKPAAEANAAAQATAQPLQPGVTMLAKPVQLGRVVPPPGRVQPVCMPVMPSQAAPSQAAPNMTSGQRNCKWCEMGDCWSHMTKEDRAKRKGVSVEDIEDAPPSKKRKIDVSTLNICWDLVRNQCKNGDSCPFDHAATIEFLHVQAHQGSHVKGRTDEERAAAKAEYATWAEERVVAGSDPEGRNACSLDWWYCQVCLVCLKECDWNVYNASHKASKTHKAKFVQDGGYALKPDVQRPNPELQRPFQEGTVPEFVSVAGFTEAKVLTLGEQDYSFSLAVAKTQLSASQLVSIVATSYLAAHDPEEAEVHVRDDGMRAHYSRKSLPGMDGALQKNIDELTDLGGLVLHSVDATNLSGTLLPQCRESYNMIVFPFPRASLQRGCQPKNPGLIRNFFRSVNKSGILETGGKIGIVLLRTQFAEWDTACLALDSGYQLVDHTALPDGFYQGREMSGKIFDSWKKIGAEIYMFQLCS